VQLRALLAKKWAKTAKTPMRIRRARGGYAPESAKTHFFVIAGLTRNLLTRVL